MGVGIGLGRAIPSLADRLDAVSIGSLSLPIAVGLLLMMYPVLARSATAGSATSPATAGCCSPLCWC